MENKPDERYLLKLYICRALNIGLSVFDPDNFKKRENSIPRNLYSFYCIELKLGTGAVASEYGLTPQLVHNYAAVLKNSIRSEFSRYGSLYEILFERINLQLSDPNNNYHFPKLQSSDLRASPRIVRKPKETIKDTGFPVSVRYKTEHGFVNTAGEIILRP